MRRKYFLMVLSCVMTLSIYGQDFTCGTEVSEKEVQFLEKALLKSKIASRARTAEFTQKFIGITAHVVRKSDGTGGLAEAQLLDAIEYLNETYEPMKMDFFLVGDINYINSDDYYDFDSSLEDQITGVHNVANTINIYFYNSLSSGASALCGYAYFPSTGRDHVMMANGCTVNRGPTLPHELGHYFNLYHTHGKTNSGTTDELVDGSNCSSAGDNLCDTAADPNLTGKVDGNCSYTGDNRDANGELFSPDPRNFMSYSRDQCMQLFSADQAGRIVDAYESFKTYLVDKYYLADFKSEGRRVCEGQNIQFIDESIAASSLLWEFPGGTPSTSTEKFPTVTYSTSGIYNVSLKIDTENGDTETKILENYVTVLGSTAGIAETAGSFEAASLEEEVLNDDLDVTFEITNAVASEGTQSIKIELSDYTAIGQEDFLIVDKLNTSVNKQFELSFDYAYARYDEQYADALEVVMKNDCGEWNTIWSKYGSDLATAADHTVPFTPTAEEWGTATLTVQIPADFDNTEFAFKTINGFGNNLYLDNYSLTPTTTTFEISGVEVTNASCSDENDGQIVINNTGSGNYEYSLGGIDFQTSNTFTSIGPGSYIVSLRDTDSNVSISSFASVGPNPIDYTTSVSNPDCSDDDSGFVEFLASGGTGALELNFNNAGFSDQLVFENLTEGIYTFQFMDENGCTTNGSINIVSQNASPSMPEIAVFSNILSFNVDSDVQSIQWYRDGTAIEGATRSTLVNPGKGSYTVEVSNEFCSALSDPFVVLTADEIRSSIVIAPNPVNALLVVDLDQNLSREILEMEIVDLTGKSHLRNAFESKTNVSELREGIYFLQLKTVDGMVVKRFFKE